jgi:hypothetical protein
VPDPCSGVPIGSNGRQCSAVPDSGEPPAPVGRRAGQSSPLSLPMTCRASLTMVLLATSKIALVTDP